MQVIDFSQVKAERLAKYHNLSNFDCDDKDINDYYDKLGFVKNTHKTYTERIQNVSMRYDLFNNLILK